MIKGYLRRFFAKAFYPTKSTNWYKKKGYHGNTIEEQFADFLSVQTQEGGVFYPEFELLKLERQLIKSGHNQLDSVLITPNKTLSNAKPGHGFYFVMFQGRGEYYESRFRDMSRQARETGASVVGFNPKGFHESTGRTKILSDIVDDGVAVIEFLLEKGVKPSKIVLQGNSLGAGVQEMVAERFRKSEGFVLRQINSNSFKNLAIIVAKHYKMPLLERFFAIPLRLAGWEIEPGPDFYKTGPNRCYIYRVGDRTISGTSEYRTKVDHEADYNNCPDSYKETNKWLNKHSGLVYIGRSKKDPHELSLHKFKVLEGNKEHSVYYLINRFLSSSLDES